MTIYRQRECRAVMAKLLLDVLEFLAFLYHQAGIGVSKVMGRWGSDRFGLRWRRLFGRFGGSVKVYSGCRSCCQNPFESISLPLLLRLWGGGQGA